MSQLFGKGTIKSNTQILSGFDSSKIEIVKDLHRDWKNGLLSDEVKYKEKFNQVFFGDVLGYENRLNRIPEGTIPGAGSADVTLGYFDDGKYTLEDIQVVCELKGAKTNLVKKQFGHGGLSPVGQGFAYKTGLKNCKWLIVSNFYEIRLYRDNTTDFEVRNLDELIDEKDDYFNLRKLYLLLHRDNLLTHTGISKTEKLLSSFREEQKEITKQFYKDYKGLRIELINDMKVNNPGIAIDILIEKAQKIIDRLIFIFFCEDKGLLPDKKLKENIVRAREAGFTSREVTTKFFHLVDVGSDSLGIPDGYNGGLFRKDDVLDALQISDGICKKFVELTNYNFDDELSVNVLGHIFEQSISDLENLKIDLLGTETETGQLVDTGKGRRKKDGIFYTPEYIVDYIVQNTVMKYLNEKEDECLSKYKKDEIKAYQAYQQLLQNIKVLDPACGSGAFLVRVFDVLFEENKRVGSILNSLFDDSETYKNILTNNIYGVDLNEESVEITKLSLWLKSAQQGKKLNNLDANIKCGNSLIDDKTISDKAFDWKKEFPSIMKDGGFDIVVGKPPYVRAELLINDKFFYEKKFEAYNGNADLYVYFIEIGIKLLKDKGYLCYITPNKWIQSNYGVGLRRFVSNYLIQEIIDFGELKIFEDATTFPSIILLKNIMNRGEVTSYTEVHSINEFVFQNHQKIFIKVISNSINWNLRGNENFLKKIENKFSKLGEIFDNKFFAGIKTGSNADLIFTKKQIEEIAKTDKEKGLFRKIVFGRDFDKYIINNNNLNYVFFPYEYKDGKNRLLNLEIYSNVYNYFQTIRDKLEKRAIIKDGIKKGTHKRYELQQINRTFNYEQEKIIYPDIGLDNRFLLDEGKMLIDMTCFFIPTNLKEYLPVLNSSFFKFLSAQYCPVLGNIKDGGRIRFKSSYLSKIPMPMITEKYKSIFVEKADKMLLLKKELHELTDTFLHRIQDNLHIAKLTKKLESFYDGDFKDFINELKKQKISLSLKDQDEREPYFNEYREVILARKAEIDRTDKEIDEMVFDLYGLTEEERRVVLGE